MTTGKRMHSDEKQNYGRVRTEKTINALKTDLLAQNWESVYKENDVDSAYNTFLRIFTSLYCKNCPTIQYCSKQKCTDQPWFTKGLKNACKKKKHTL